MGKIFSKPKNDKNDKKSVIPISYHDALESVKEDNYIPVEPVSIPITKKDKDSYIKQEKRKGNKNPTIGGLVEKNLEEEERKNFVNNIREQNRVYKKIIETQK